MDLWHDIETGPKIPSVINVIVEIPKGSQNKYEYDKKRGIIKLDRVLFSPFFYPGEYGIIPQTYAEDGDPMDALVLVSNHTYPGVLIESRPIGMLRMKDGGEMDNKILCVAKDDVRYDNLKDIADLDKHYLKEIGHFFEVYKQLEGKKVEILGWKNAASAKKEVLAGIKLYQKKFKK
ncbi:inorganic diphosphatase [Candidatus Nitrosotalea bavarica]|jgi:inorganic pyrophosphatase|uniref:inorganic diphosphatase n=1 Tax=Candidatus Nitrosotalea bavarica TaxID=1903277 RepID=UPI000C706F69|nr:inorganic diphosphatase [Candidatus Nitrosotalea bavarica]